MLEIQSPISSPMKDLSSLNEHLFLIHAIQLAIHNATCNNIGMNEEITREKKWGSGWCVSTQMAIIADEMNLGEMIEWDECLCFVQHFTVLM